MTPRVVALAALRLLLLLSRTSATLMSCGPLGRRAVQPCRREATGSVLRARTTSRMGVHERDAGGPTATQTSIDLIGPPPSLAEVLASDSCLADAQLTCVLLAAAGACQEIAKALRVLSLAPAGAPQQGGGAVNPQGETQKGMDVLANDLFTAALSGHVASMASEEEEAVIAGATNRMYEVAFDPLDGRSNLDTNLPTGSIFGVFEHTPGHPFTGSGREKHTGLYMRHMYMIRHMYGSGT